MGMDDVRIGQIQRLLRAIGPLDPGPLHLGIHHPVHHLFQQLPPVGPPLRIDLLQPGNQLLGRADDQGAQQHLVGLELGGVVQDLAPVATQAAIHPPVGTTGAGRSASISMRRSRNTCRLH